MIRQAEMVPGLRIFGQKLGGSLKLFDRVMVLAFANQTLTLHERARSRGAAACAGKDADDGPANHSQRRTSNFDGQHQFWWYHSVFSVSRNGRSEAKQILFACWLSAQLIPPACVGQANDSFLLPDQRSTASRVVVVYDS